MLKRLTPHLIAVAIFALLTVIFFMPLYQGKVLAQNDVMQWEGMSKEITDWNNQHPDDHALWTNRMFGGMPGILIASNFSGNLVNKIILVLQTVFPDATVALFMMFFGFYVLLLCVGVDNKLALAGSLAYGLTSFLIISLEAGHNTKVVAMSMMAPVLGGVILAYRGKYITGAAVTALFLSLAINANHLQVIYYLLIVLAVIAIYYFVESILTKTIPSFFKASGLLLIAGIIAALPHIGNLWATQEYAKETIRGGSSELTQKKQATDGGLDFEYATRWSYGLSDGEILSLLIPNIKGGSSSEDVGEESEFGKQLQQRGYATNYTKQAPAYWGNQPFTSGPVYLGAGIMFLFILSFFVVRGSIKWALLALTVISILLAAGHNTPFFKFLFNTLPFFNKFRTPAMALVIAELTIPLSALLALKSIYDGETDEAQLRKWMKISLGITAGILVLFGFLGGMFFNFSSAGDQQYYGNNMGWMVDALKKDRAALLQSDALRSLFFVAATFVAVWFFAAKKLSQTIFAAVIGLIFLADGWSVSKRYMHNEKFVESNAYKGNFAPSEVDLQILRDTDPNYRVFNVTGDPFNDALTSYHHKSVGGYHPAKLIRYQDLIENQISKNNMSVLNMLNTKYFIVKNPATNQPAVQQNSGALGNAWFISNIQWAKNADEEMSALSNFDPSSTVIIDERYKTKVGNLTLSADSTSSIKETVYSPNKLVYESNAGTEQFAVFSEIFYDEGKGWQAYIDGNKAEHVRVNYVLRGMKVPAGKHTIEFKFEPTSIATGNSISFVGSLLLFAFVFGTFGMMGYKQMQQTEPTATGTKPQSAKKKK